MLTITKQIKNKNTHKSKNMLLHHMFSLQLVIYLFSFTSIELFNVTEYKKIHAEMYRQ